MGTSNDEVEQLRLENVELRATVASLLARVAELEARLASNPRNSSMPPSAEGFTKPPSPSRAERRAAGRHPGKQPGDQGHRLERVEHPDHVVFHAPATCCGCGSGLASAPVTSTEVRQVFDLPEVRAVVTEHRVERRRCSCGVVTSAAFPREAIGPTCYGPSVRALLCYLVVAQHLPIERACEVLAECCGTRVSAGFASALVAEASEGLSSFVTATRDALMAAPTLHLDETGARVAGSLGWVHVASTSERTSFLFHRRRGRVAIDAHGVLSGYDGVAIHDGFTPYRTYPVTHGLCNAHHLRELLAVAESGQPWAKDMAELLRGTLHQVHLAKASGATSLSRSQLKSVTARYDELVRAGLAANPPPVRTGKRGRPSRTKAGNLADRLDRYRADVLRFATDFSVPFENNQAERDIRMVKLQQKISGSFRTETGASSFLTVRSYISTARKQQVNVLDALRDLFEGKPFLLGVAGA